MSITPDARPPGRPFNEQAALEELERLQRAIEESRRRRKESGAAFDAFVRSFQKERPSRVEPAPPIAKPVAPAVPSESVAVAPAIVTDPEPPPAIVEPPPLPAPIAASPVGRRGKPFPVLPAIAGAAVAIAAAVVLIGRPWGASAPGSERVEPRPAVTSVRTANPGPGTASPESRPAPPGPPRSLLAPAASTGALDGELIAVRRVWVRIITDGNKVERDLPAGSRVPLHAARAITLRIGDAGAVKVTLDNRDQGPLGRDGEVVMRTFTAQTPAR